MSVCACACAASQPFCMSVSLLPSQLSDMYAHRLTHSCLFVSSGLPACRPGLLSCCRHSLSHSYHYITHVAMSVLPRLSHIDGMATMMAFIHT